MEGLRAVNSGVGTRLYMSKAASADLHRRIRCNHVHKMIPAFTVVQAQRRIGLTGGRGALDASDPAVRYVRDRGEHVDFSAGDMAAR